MESAYFSDVTADKVPVKFSSMKATIRGESKTLSSLGAENTQIVSDLTRLSGGGKLAKIEVENLITVCMEGHSYIGSNPHMLNSIFSVELEHSHTYVRKDIQHTRTHA